MADENTLISSVLEDPLALVELPRIPPRLWRYEYKKTGQDKYEWIESPLRHALADILPFPESIHTQILLVEGLTDEVIDKCCSKLGTRRGFSPTIKATNFRRDFLIPVAQIQSRIEKGTPYDIDTFKDPESLKLDHERYKQVSSIFRQYCILNHTMDGTLQNAARECISVFWIHDSPSLFILVVADPKREYSITTKSYSIRGVELGESSSIEPCFLKEVDGYVRGRFFEELKKCNEQVPRLELIDRIRKILAHIIATDTNEVLDCLHEVLDSIDLSQSKDEILRNSLHIWRESFGLWRQDLLHSLASVKHMLQTSEQQQLCPTCAPQVPSMTVPIYDLELKRLRNELDEALTRLSSTFQAVMSTMSIVESQKAISEAEAVSKLTALAFFFIPLSFVASLFGMNLIEFDHQLKVWMWISVSAVIMILTYGLLFLGRITRALRDSSRIRQSMNPQRIGTLAMRWARMFIILSPMIIPLGCIGLGVGLWKLFTSDLSKGAKAGIGVAVLGFLTAVGVIPPLAIRPRRNDIGES